MRLRTLIGSTAVVALALVGCGDDSTSTTSEEPQTTVDAATAATEPEPKPDATMSVAPETTAFVPDADVVVTGIDTDQPCSAITQSGELPETGFALHEIAAMTIDPREGLELVGDEWVYESFFIDNAWFGSQWPAGCAIATDLGRITGHEQSLIDFSVMHPPQAFSYAHVFETEAGAEAYMGRVVAASEATTGSTTDSTTKPSVSTEPLPDAGPGATIVHMTSNERDGEIALVHKGLVVGEVQVFASPDDELEFDVVELGQRAWAQIDSVVPSGEPFELTAMMSAPLPLAAWGPAYSEMEWDTGYAGGRDNWEFAQYSPDPVAAAAEAEQFDRLVGYQNTYGLYEEPPMWIATGLTTYGDDPGAEAAFEHIVADRLAGSDGGEPAEQFDVPGVEGAVGLVRLTQSNELVTEVFFPYGPAIGRVYIIHSGVSDTEAFDERAEVIRITQTWMPRLDQILGPAA